MISNKRKFTTGFLMMVGFAVVLVLFFSPILNGRNGLAYLDDLYNSISKGSAYYIAKVRDEVRPLDGQPAEAVLKMADEELAQQVARVLAESGATTRLEADKVQVKGDLGRILGSCLDDADAMYVNDGAKVSRRYGMDEKLALFTWWKALQALEKELKKQKKFEQGKMVDLVNRKAVEASYNYYGIEPQHITDRLGIVLFSLIFYVAYTLWYGFAFMYMFEGWGVKLEH